ncbi:MAG TPA: hypothetical protein VG370_30550 [Chloroflexota bacterium]|jgi:hypothetical protein|nr:hypothetical protein [Chloroflexota bacterium]
MLDTLHMGEATQQWLVACMRRVAVDGWTIVNSPRLAPCVRARYTGGVAAVLGELRSLGGLDELVHHYYFERDCLVERATAAIGRRRISPIVALDAAVWRRLHELGASEGSAASSALAS